MLLLALTILAQTSLAQAPLDDDAPVADCLTTALESVVLTDQQAASLCLGAVSEAPAACFEAARQETFLTDTQAVTLCRCATDLQPVACFLEVQSETFLEEYRILQFCAPVLTGAVTPSCLAPVYPYGPYP
jgi:hypothetical protein